mgnify:CR=1 FL=1
MDSDAVRDEVWFAPHREGMLRIEARISHVGRQESAIIELLADGGVVTPDMIADYIWPARRPKDWHELVEHRMVRVRKLLPPLYVMTVYDETARLARSGMTAFFCRPHTPAPLVGWQLTGKINIHPG